MRRRNFSPAILSSLILLVCMTHATAPSSTTEQIIPLINAEPITTEEDTVEMSWTSHDDLEPKPLTNSTTCIGDHIMLNATFSDNSVTTSEITLTRGFTFETTRELVIPRPNYTAFFEPIEFDQLDWVIVEGINEFDVVSVTGNGFGLDIDFMVWWVDTDNSTWDYTNNIVVERMATAAVIESTTFLADRDGAIAVACFNFAVLPGNYSLMVSTLVEHTEVSQGSSVHYDTYGYLPFNATLDLIVTGLAEDNTSISQYFENITLNNYFAPDVEDVIVESDRSLHSISWTVNDLNVQDNHLFEVAVSSDSGLSFQLLSVHLDNNFYVWNSSSFDNGVYVIQIRAIDDFGFVGVGISESFEGGPWSPMIISFSVAGSDNIQYEEGEVGNWVWWLPTCNYSLAYTIFLDSYFIEASTWTSGAISVSADGLEVGSYEYLIVLVFDEYNTLNHSVHVTVVERSNSTLTVTITNTIVTTSITTSTHTVPTSDTTNTTGSDWTTFMQGVQIVTTLFSGIVIVVFSALLLRWRVRNTMRGGSS